MLQTQRKASGEERVVGGLERRFSPALGDGFLAVLAYRLLYIASWSFRPFWPVPFIGLASAHRAVTER